jgi:hypothetical protein
MYSKVSAEKAKKRTPQYKTHFMKYLTSFTTNFDTDLTL